MEGANIAPLRFTVKVKKILEMLKKSVKVGMSIYNIKKRSLKRKVIRCIEVQKR
jgi:hypothetical protein